MERTGALLSRTAGRAVVMALATAVGFVLYQKSQDIGLRAHDRYFPTLPEVATPQQDLFLLLFWLILPALLAALAVGVPAVRLRLKPEAILLCCCGGSALAVSSRFPPRPEPWGFALLEIYALSLAPVLLLAWFLVRCRRASLARGGSGLRAPGRGGMI